MNSNNKQADTTIRVLVLDGTRADPVHQRKILDVVRAPPGSANSSHSDENSRRQHQQNEVGVRIRFGHQRQGATVRRVTVR